MTLVVEADPAVVSICHCDFCQNRTGSVFQVGAYFGPEEPFAITRLCSVPSGFLLSATSAGAWFTGAREVARGDR